MTTPTLDAWTDLDRLRPLLSGFVRLRLRDEHDVEDVVQEALLRAARYRAVEGEPEKLRAWMFRIAENTVMDHRRRSRRTPVSGVEAELLEGIEGREDAPGDEREDEPVLADEGPIERQRVFRCAARALRGLAREDQALLERYYGGAGRCRDIARQMEVDQGSVKSRLYRARRRLLLLLRRELAAEAESRRGGARAAHARTDNGGGARCAAAARRRRRGAKSAARGKR